MKPLVQRVVLHSMSCPVCGKQYHNSSLYVLTSNPSITVYPCGCKQQLINAKPPSTEGGESRDMEAQLRDEAHMWLGKNPDQD